MKYIELRKQHQDKVDALPLKFAFSRDQFKSAMSELGLTENDTDKISWIGLGGFCLKTDKEAVDRVFDETYDEMNKAMRDDEFCIDAIEYEMGNHEYALTYDMNEVLESLGLNGNNERIQKLFLKAEQRYFNSLEHD